MATESVNKITTGTIVAQSVSQSVIPLVNMDSVTIRHTIGQARCWREKQVVHIEYSGIISDSVMEVIGPQVVEYAGFDVVLIRMDKAIMTWPYEITIKENVCLRGYGVFVVRPEHRLVALLHCHRLARAGIWRTVFVDQAYPSAVKWATSLAALPKPDCQVSRSTPA